MGEITIWPYGAALAAALVLIMAGACTFRKAKGHALAAAAGAVLCGLVCARLVWCCVNYSKYILGSPALIADIGGGGLSLFAGFSAGVFFVCRYAKRHSLSALRLLDALTPGLALSLLVLRAAEHFTGQGVGRETVSLTMPLLTMADEWGMLRFNVRLYEAAAAFAAFMTVLFISRKREGAAFTVGTAIVCASQLVFENMRDDDFLMIQFIRIEQLICALILLALSVMLVKRTKKRPLAIACLVTLLIGAAVVIKQDFAVDASQEPEREYLIMAAGAVLMLVSVIVPACFLKKRKKQRVRNGAGFVRTALSLIVFAALIAACTLYVPSAGFVESIPEKMMPGYVEPTPTPTPVPTPVPTPTPEPTPVPTLTPVPSPEPETAVQAEAFATPEPSPTPTPTPTPTPKPTPVPLPMDSLSGGVKPDSAAFTSSGYSDDTIEVRIWKERIKTVEKGKTYLSTVAYADIRIATPAQLRTAIAGDEKNIRTSNIDNLSRRVNAVVGINGDYYGLHSGTYVVRQGKIIRNETTNPLDTLIIDYNGDMHIYRAADRLEGLKEWKNNIYQCFFFGPALIIDGEKVQGLAREKYGFGSWAMNPRTAIGQIGPLHYLLVVAEGRNSDSCGINCDELADLMAAKGCQQAFNLDGGATSVMVYNNKKYTAAAREGYRQMYDILYFASAQP